MSTSEQEILDTLIEASNLVNFFDAMEVLAEELDAPVEAAPANALDLAANFDLPTFEANISSKSVQGLLAAKEQVTEAFDAMIESSLKL